MAKRFGDNEQEGAGRDLVGRDQNRLQDINSMWILPGCTDETSSAVQRDEYEQTSKRTASGRPVRDTVSLPSNEPRIGARLPRPSSDDDGRVSPAWQRETKIMQRLPEPVRQLAILVARGGVIDGVRSRARKLTAEEVGRSREMNTCRAKTKQRDLVPRRRFCTIEA